MKTKLLRKLRKRFAWKFNNLDEKWHIIHIKTLNEYSNYVISYRLGCDKLTALDDTCVSLEFMLNLLGKLSTFKSRHKRIAKRLNKHEYRIDNFIKRWRNERN